MDDNLDILKMAAARINRKLVFCNPNDIVRNDVSVCSIHDLVYLTEKDKDILEAKSKV